MTNTFLGIKKLDCKGDSKAGGAASEFALDDLLCVASKHYAEMAPHVRKRKTAELLFRLIEQNKMIKDILLDLLKTLEPTYKLSVEGRDYLNNVMEDLNA